MKFGMYRHYKHQTHVYEVIGLARHSETLEEMVVYKALYDSPDYPKGSIWVRPKGMFMEKVLVNGKEVPRFEFIK